MSDETWEEFVAIEGWDVKGFNLLKEKAIIRRIGKEWCVISESTGKKMGCYPSRPAAVKRLQQVEMFKHMRKGDYNSDPPENQFYCSSCGSYWLGSDSPDDTASCPICGLSDSVVEVNRPSLSN